MVQEKISSAKDLYQNGLYDDAIVLYHEIMEEDLDRFQAQCKFYYMWSIYKKYIASSKVLTEDIGEDAKNAVKYIINNSDNKQVIYQYTVMKVIKHLENENNYDAKKMQKWLDKLDPEILSEESSEYKRDDGKVVVYSSSKEKWYTLKSKAAFELQMYQLCIDVSTKALSTLKVFNHDSDVWLKRRIALSYSKLGQLDEASNLMELIITSRKEWFLYQELGDIYQQQGKSEEALDYYFKGLLKPGQDEFKINLIKKISDLIRAEYPNQSNQLMDFVIKVKLKSGWKLDQTENGYYDEHQSEIDKTGYKTAREKIYLIAEELSRKKMVEYNGVISKILPNGTTGFISSNNKSYYFRFNEFRGREEISVGLKVLFYVEKSFDKVKNKESEIAVSIRTRGSNDEIK